MAYHRVIWDHEKSQTYRIAGELIDGKPTMTGWRFLLFPITGGKYLLWRNKARFTARNLLLTKQMAFNAAREIAAGTDRSLALGSVDAKTRELLGSAREEFYSEKIRKRQLDEIALLTDHYTELLKTPGKSFNELISTVYENKNGWLKFLNDLEEREQAVIEAALSTVRKGSRRERTEWFRRVQDTTRRIRREEADRIFPGSGD